MKTYNTELKPCPFCGGEVSISLHGIKSSGYWWSINRGMNKETKCECRLFLESEKFSWDNKERKDEEYNKLIKHWNTRV